MEEAKLLKFIYFIKQECEYRIEEDDVIIWVRFYDLKDLTEIFGYEQFVEGGYEVTLFDDCVAFTLDDFFFDEEEIEFIKNKLSVKEE